MTAAAVPPAAGVGSLFARHGRGPVVAAVVAFALAAAPPAASLARDWWINPEAGHGLLLAPLAAWLVWHAGWRHGDAPRPALGLFLLATGVLLRVVAGVASELFTLRLSPVVMAAGLVVAWGGLRQLRAWGLPLLLLALSVPLPALITTPIALPLQFFASRVGVALLQWRDVPVQLAGNVIQLPGQSLFVAEACSGLRSLSALLSLGVIAAWFWLRHPLLRLLLVMLAIPIAVGVNAVRVFLTAFLVTYVDPGLGDGFMHATEGWLLFLVSFGLLFGCCQLLALAERGLRTRAAAAREPAHA